MEPVCQAICLETIGSYAFSGVNISSLSFPSTIKRIESSAFADCGYLSCQLHLPSSLTYIGDNAFRSCSLSGNLILPDNIDTLGMYAFDNAGTFSGGLTIPEKIKSLGPNTFYGTGFNGSLNLNNVTEIGYNCFYDCGFQGELVIPEGTQIIEKYVFHGNGYTNVIFPSTLKEINAGAFKNNSKLMDMLQFPEGVIAIGTEAFSYCRNIGGVWIPSSLQTMGDQAFQNCFGIYKIVSLSVEPPAIQPNSFNGVAKDNFTLEVPENAVTRYRADIRWKEFRRIAAHYDFSVNRSISRVLNGEKSTTYILRAPANYNWSIESKPDWIEVTPSSGVGKTEIKVTFSKMEDSDVQKVSRELYGPTGAYIGKENFDGRVGEIVFLLDGKDYRTSMAVEQFDYEYDDGDVVELNKATKGNGVNIVFMGDCYDAKDIAFGTYIEDLKQGMEYLFAVEPYKTYRDYFNVYAVFGISDDSGMGTVNTVRSAKFGSQYSLEGISPDYNTCYEYAAKAINNMDPAKTMVVLIENTTDYGGICYMWSDGSAIACCPKSADAYPYDFRGIVQHEAGGHGFAKLADEYIYHSTFISTCNCNCCKHVKEFYEGRRYGFYRNLELTGDNKEVGWSHLIFHPQYSDNVDVYEGGFYHSRGVFRSEPISCMNNNIPYYSAYSRQIIVERIMEYAGEQFSLENFYANDSDEFGATKAAVDNFDNLPSRNSKHHSPVLVGEKPEFKR